MDNPNYVFKFNELIRVPVKKTKTIGVLKIVTIIIVLLMIVLSIIFKDNLFNELSFGVTGLLIALIIRVFFLDKQEKVPSEIEIRFFDEYLDIYREKCYYNRFVTRKEHNKFYYKDITRCTYQTSTNRLNIYGLFEGIWYNYQKNGILPNEPDYHKTIDAMCYFYIDESQKDYLISEIEKHSPIKVIFEEL